MPNIANVLKSEIARISRRELRAEVSGLRKASANYRREIAELKRQLANLRKDVAAVVKGTKKPSAAPAELKTAHRFQAKGLRTLRARLGLSSEAFAKLVGVSAQSIYNWEHGKATPRPTQLAALAAVRKMGKRDAQAAVAKRK